MVIFATAIFLAAFLLFLIQPIAAKALLPVFGGGASIWLVCLMFFQAGLLAGYAWSHVARRALHPLLLGLAAVAAASPGATPEVYPAWDILRVLAVSLGLPVVALAATSPLFQRWSGSPDPYRLYALSNAASLTALVAYPILIEPWMSLPAQFRFWKLLLWAFVAVALAATWKAAPMRSAAASGPLRLSWFTLPACGAALLAATTNQLCQELAPMPLLWVVPLALYLVSYILAFDHPRWYDRTLYSLLGAVLVPVTCTLVVVGLSVSVWIHVVVLNATLYVCAMLCHGELALLRPDPTHLTRFYLAVAAGAVAGTGFVSLGAPLLFSSYLEFPLLMAAAIALQILVRFRLGELARFRYLPAGARAPLVGLAFALVAPLLVIDARNGPVVEARRSFYGVLRVTETAGVRTLTHGATTHGSQFTDAARRRTPTTYYGWESGAGQVLANLAAPPPRRVGVIGLGVGTLARFAAPGDLYRFYEISPDVIEFARSHFTFLADSAARIEIEPGDARLRLAAESPQAFDVLVVDAFSSDAIPIHLLTTEAAAVYRRHLKPDGVLLFHISNHTLNLEPVVRGLARRIAWHAVRADSSADPRQATHGASWMILAADRERLARLSVRSGTPPAPPLEWTDNYSSILRVLK